MGKPDCSYSFERSREVTILGAPVRVKNYLCSRNGGEYRMKPERAPVQLSILPTRLCNARCPFCIAAPTDDPAKIDPDRLEPMLKALAAEGSVRGVTITGGEPCLDMDLLDRILRMCFDAFGGRLEVTLDTNGSGLQALTRLRDLYRINAIHISRHHWDDGINDRIFGRQMPAAAELRDVLHGIACPGLFVLNCMLLKGYVETAEDAHRYMDFAIETGAGKVSFITGSPVNPWIAERVVLFDDVLRDGDPSILFTQEFRDFDLCRCRDGVYVSPRGQLMEFYGRQTCQDQCGYCRGLVIGPDGALRAGFSGEILYPRGGDRLGDP